MKSLVPAVAFTLLALAAACGGDDEQTATGTPGGLTPVGTKDATPTSSAGVAVAPTPLDPTLDEELTEIDAGSFDETIAPGGSWSINTAAVALGAPCTNFALDFTWQVQDPYPPDGVELAWQFTREAGTVEVASGPAGEQSVGCGLLELINRGEGDVTVAILYRAGAIE